MAKYWYAAGFCLCLALAGWLLYALALFLVHASDWHLTAKTITLVLVFFGGTAALLIRRAFQFQRKSRNFAKPS